MRIDTVSLSSSFSRTCTIGRHTDKLMSAKLLRKLGNQLSHLGMIANTCTIILKSTDWGGRRMVRCRSGNRVSGLLRLQLQIQVTCRGAVKCMCSSPCIYSNLCSSNPGFEELNSGALKQWYEIDKGTGDVRASEQPDYHGNSWAQGGVRGDENPPQMFMKQHVGSSVKDEIGAGQWLQLDCSDMRTSEESAKPAALLRMQLNEGLGRTKEENNTPVGQKQGEDLDGYTPFDAASLQIHSNMKALEVNLEPSPHNSHRRGFLIENDARTLQLDLNTAVVKEDFAMASALRGMSSRASIPRSAVTGPSLPPRPNFGSFRSIHLYTRAEAGARRGRRSPSPAAVGSRRSVSPPFRAPSPTPSRVGSIGGKSNASTNSKMDILRFQTYDGQVRKPSSMADYEDIGSIFANPVQVYYSRPCPYAGNFARTWCVCMRALVHARQTCFSFYALTQH